MNSKSYEYCFYTHDQESNIVETPELSRIIRENTESDKNVQIISVEVGENTGSPLIVLIREEIAQLLSGKKVGHIKINGVHKHWNCGIRFVETSNCQWAVVAGSAESPEATLGWRIYVFRLDQKDTVFSDLTKLTEVVENWTPPKVKVNHHLVNGRNARRPEAGEVVEEEEFAQSVMVFSAPPAVAAPSTRE